MKQHNEKQPIKTYESLLNKDRTVENYDYFLSDKVEKKPLSSLDRENLENLIETVLDILSGEKSTKEIDESNPNIQIELIAPQLLTTPITSANVKYTYITKPATSSSKGVYGRFLSLLKRKNEEAPWQYGYIPLTNGYNVSIVTKFEKSNFDKLHLNFSEKFFITDLESKKHALDFYSTTDYKQFAESGDNDANYAFYKFTTSRNSVPLTVVFGVLKDQYNENETHPKNWFYVYMKRDN